MDNKTMVYNTMEFSGLQIMLDKMLARLKEKGSVRVSSQDQGKLLLTCTLKIILATTGIICKIWTCPQVDLEHHRLYSNKVPCLKTILQTHITIKVSIQILTEHKANHT